MSELRVLLGVTYIQLNLTLMCRSSISQLEHDRLDYNELKLLILELLFTHGPSNSESLVKKLAELKQVTLDIHALRMALMRYHKQGLLKREKSRGSFVYMISERGILRLKWLEEQVRSSTDDT